MKATTVLRKQADREGMCYPVSTRHTCLTFALGWADIPAGQKRKRLSGPRNCNIKHTLAATCICRQLVPYAKLRIKTFLSAGLTAFYAFFGLTYV